MFGNGKSVVPLQRSAVARPAATSHLSETISSISSEMTVVGKISCQGVLKIHGLVEGELNASSVFIAPGARILGDIVAEDLTVGGRVKGDIHAVRVKLQETAVVEGDIFHRSLSIEENARFHGSSHPEDNEPPSSVKVESLNPQHQPQLVAFDDKGEIKEDRAHFEFIRLCLRRLGALAGFARNQLHAPAGGSGIHAFLSACLAIVALSAVNYCALNVMQQPTGRAYVATGVRIDPTWIGR